MEKEEIKDIAITLLQTLINATGAEFEEENYAVDIIAKTIEETVKKKKREEVTFKEYAEACKVISSFDKQCKDIRELRRKRKSDDIDVLLFEARKDLANAYDFERRVGIPIYFSPHKDIKVYIKKLLKRKFKK